MLADEFAAAEGTVVVVDDSIVVACCQKGDCKMQECCLDSCGM